MGTSLPDLEVLEAPDLVEGWRNLLSSNTSGLSDNTVKSYLQGLRRFIMFACPNPEERQFRHLRRSFTDPKHLRQTIDELSGEYGATTVGLSVAAAKSFAEFLIEDGEIQTQPTWPKVRVSTTDDFDPPHYDHGEKQALVTAAAEPVETISLGARVRDPIRDVAILQVLFTLGLRAAELTASEFGWIRGENQDTILRVLGKGNKVRVLPIGQNQELLQVINNWLDHRRNVIGPTASDAPLFCDRQGNQIHYDKLIYLFNLWLQLSEIRHAQDPENKTVRRFKGRAKLHACRHSAAFDLIAQGVPLNLIQGMLGHKSIATTSLYLKATGQELATAIKATQIPRPLEPPGAR